MTLGLRRPRARPAVALALRTMAPRAGDLASLKLLGPSIVAIATTSNGRPGPCLVLGRSGFQLEQETPRVGEIDVGNIARDRTVRASIEQPGQDRSSQEVWAARRLELQHRPRELAEHDAGQPRIERGEQRGDIRDLAFARGLAHFVSNRVVVGQGALSITVHKRTAWRRWLPP